MAILSHCKNIPEADVRFGDIRYYIIQFSSTGDQQTGDGPDGQCS